MLTLCPSFTEKNSSGKAAIDAIPHHLMFPSRHDVVISAARARDHAVVVKTKSDNSFAGGEEEIEDIIGRSLLMREGW